MRRSLLLGAACAAMAAAAPQFARAEVDYSRPIQSVCYATPGQPLARERLAEAFLAEAGIRTIDVADAYRATKGDVALSAYGALALDVAKAGRLPGQPSNSTLRKLVQVTEERLVVGSGVTAKEAGLVVKGDVPARANKPSDRVSGWLFDPNRQITLECAPGKPPPTIVEEFEDKPSRSRVSIRGTVDELGLTGKDAREAGAFKLGYKREESEKDDGSTKTDKTTTLNGTVGFRLTPKDALTPLYLYGTYALSEARTKPAPPLDPGKKVGDGDTDVLEVGLSLAPWLARAEADYSLVVGGQIADVKDYVKDSERLKGRVTLEYGNPFNIGPFCKLGGFLTHGSGFRTRCRLIGEIEGSHVFDKGAADFKEHGEFVSAGGSFSYDIAAPLSDKAAVIATATYRYLPTISGTAPDIERFDASVKYRIWLENGVGLDLGLSYAKGEEPKSYVDEDKLELGIGVIF